MPKKSEPVTNEELARVADAFLELRQDLIELAKRMQSTYMAGQAPKSETLMRFAGLANEAGEVVRIGLGKKALAEDKTELETELRKRQADEASS